MPSVASSSGSSGSTRPPRPTWPNGSSTTDTAIRQHLESLEEAGLVERFAAASTGRGRPPIRWRITELAGDLFPDRHGELTVELISAIREALGEDGLRQVIAVRSARQLDAYRQALGPVEPLGSLGTYRIVRCPVGTTAVRRSGRRRGSPAAAPGGAAHRGGISGRGRVRRRRARPRRAPLPGARCGRSVRGAVRCRARAFPKRPRSWRQRRALPTPPERRRPLRLPHQ